MPVVTKDPNQSSFSNLLGSALIFLLLFNFSSTVYVFFNSLVT